MKDYHKDNKEAPIISIKERKLDRKKKKNLTFNLKPDHKGYWLHMQLMFLCGIIRCKHFPEYYWPKYLFLKLFPDVGHLVVIAFWASKGKLHRVYVM